MDLVRGTDGGYTGSVNPLTPDKLTGDTALEPALSGDAGAIDPDARCIQVVADDEDAAACWCESLRAEGLVRFSGAADDGQRLAVVMHITRRLPDRLGLLRQLRVRDGALPLIVVCQQLRDLDHVLALEMGADDVIDASASAAVVAARLRASARRQRTASVTQTGPEQLFFGALALHLRERRVCVHDIRIDLTEGEFEVLWLLASQAGRPVSRDELLRRLRGLPYQRIDRSIDCRIYRIRAKLGDADGPTQRIRTVRNCGYLFSPAAW